MPTETPTILIGFDLPKLPMKKIAINKRRNASTRLKWRLRRRRRSIKSLAAEGGDRSRFCKLTEPPSEGRHDRGPGGDLPGLSLSKGPVPGGSGGGNRGPDGRGPDRVLPRSDARSVAQGVGGPDPRSCRSW